jgi:pimeloyl-ACP methyl ester carboxylesterase
MDLLASRFHAISIDWPGFGTQSRPPLSWTPDAMASFLEYAIEALGGTFYSIVAAGHSATYVLNYLSKHTIAADTVVLIAPTWRGPPPTMAGRQHPLFGKVKRSIESDFFGPFLYRLNVNPFMVKMMVAGHVYSDKKWLSGVRMQEKRKVTEGENARFASAAFVAGGLDLLSSRNEFLKLASNVSAPILLVYGAQTPPRSRAEMEALSELPGVQTALLHRGKLLPSGGDVGAAVRPVPAGLATGWPPKCFSAL